MPRCRELREKRRSEVFISSLLEAVPEDDKTLSDLIRLAAYTGCRIDELCSLRLSDVKLTDRIPCFLIEDAKTAAGNRKVPIHSAIKQLVAQLKDTSQDDYRKRRSTVTWVSA